MRRDTPRQGQKRDSRGHADRRAPRVRLGSGDVVPVGAPNPYARLLYLEAVSRCMPEAIDELMACDPSDERRLRAWADRWGFTDLWALHAAQLHAAFWREEPSTRGRWQIASVFAWSPVYEAVPVPRWDPTLETEASFRKRQNAYRAVVKALPGVQRTPQKGGSDQHFEWLALHHAGGWTYDTIGGRYQTDAKPSTVGEAIVNLAELIGLTLRPTPRGPARR